MGGIFLLLTVLAFITVELILKRREKLREATESLELGEPARIFPYRVAHELPGGLFFHSGHTWAKLEPSGTVQVGLGGFAREVLGRVDRFELPATGVKVRQGEPAFAALQSGKRIEFVSPVDGVVCAVNERINADPAAAREGPHEKGG